MSFPNQLLKRRLRDAPIFHTLALIMLGRGDYDIDECDDARAAARDGIEDCSADFMIGDAALPAYLLEGLEAFGEDCLG